VYDSWGRLDQIHHERGAITLLSLDYTRDRRGLIKGVVEVRESQPTVTWTYVYDRPKRLTQAARAIAGGSTAVYGYTYDDAGNRLSESVTGETTVNYTYNAWDQLVEDNAHTYEYDSYGNLSAQKTRPSGVFEYQYFWSGANELTEGRIYSGGALDHTVYFSYDDQRTRTAKRVNTAAGSLLSETAYLTDYENPTGLSQTLAEYNPADPSSTRAYVYGDALLAQSDAPAGGTPLGFLHTDHSGSTRLLTNGSGASIVSSQLDFEPYGDPLVAPSSLTPYHFTGQYRDADLKFQYQRARWLNTATSLWLSADPVFDFPGGFAAYYAYCGLSPIDAFDLSGRFTTAELAVANQISGVLHDLQYAVGRGIELSARMVLGEISMREALRSLLIDAIIAGSVLIGMYLLASLRILTRVLPGK
jgi:RHS repeat-associated protein